MIQHIRFLLIDKGDYDVGCVNNLGSLSAMKAKLPSLRRTKAQADAAYRSAFAQRLKRAAENHDIAEIAAQIGVRPATLYRWLSARFDPSLPKLADFAAATNVNLAWLVSGQGPLDPRQAMRHAMLEEYAAIDFAPADAKAAKAPLAFHEPWLFQLLFGSWEESKLLGPTPTQSAPLLMEVGEDSMEPTIAKGDLLLIDRSCGLSPTEIRQAQLQARSPLDGIYAFQPRCFSFSVARARSARQGRQGFSHFAIPFTVTNQVVGEDLSRRNLVHTQKPAKRQLVRGTLAG
jgi:phage repressor protein C with HTH and peptisase S24 domain